MKQYLSFFMVLLVVLSIAVPMGSADTAQSSATVLNKYPQFMEFRIQDSDTGNWSDWIKYDSEPTYEEIVTFKKHIGQIGHFEDLWASGASDPTNTLDNPSEDEYRLVVTPSASDSKIVPIEVKIQDLNGYDDLTKTQIYMILDSNDAWVSIPEPDALLTLDRNEGSTVGIYNGSFEVYPTSPFGEWLISFRFKDANSEDDWPETCGWYLTSAAQFYVGKVISLGIEVDTINFGAIDPGVCSNEVTTRVINNGNTAVTVDICPSEMDSSAVSDVLAPWNCLAEGNWSSEDVPGSEGSPDGCMLIAGPIGWTPEGTDPFGTAGFMVNPALGTQSATYGGTIGFTAR